MKLSILLAFACTLLSSSLSADFQLSSVNGQQCNGRVRRDWDSLSASDKATYRGAIASAMDSGAYIKFVEIHTEMMSEMEAHRQCMFIYWHRLLLIVFENMLRGQGSQYACVTIPYWDWVSAHSRFANGQCRSMAECSPILTELGGVPSGSQQGQFSINGIATQGYCVSADPVNHFCQSTSARTSGQCVQCVPRGAWGSLTFPGSASLASIRSQIFGSSNIAEMSGAIENGAHNAIHAALAGAMETFASNSDPIFYSHHAMVDLLHVTFHHCRVGDAMLTLEQKASNSIGWSSCQRRNGGVFSPLDTVLMRTGEGGANPTYVSQDTIIGQYFQGVPNQWAALMDVRDIGVNSYSYEMGGVLGNMYTNCDGSPAGTPPANNNAGSAPAPQTNAGTPSGSGLSLPFANIGFGSSPIIQGIGSIIGRLFNRGGRKLRSQTDSYSFKSVTQQSSPPPSSSSTSTTTTTTTSKPTTSSSSDPSSASTSTSTSTSTNSTSSSSTMVTTTTTASFVSIVSTKTDAFVQNTQDWCDDTEKQVQAVLGSSSGATATTSSVAEVEKMMCMFQDECLGGVSDYSVSFKKSFMVSSKPRCKLIVDDIASGKTKLQLPNWKDVMVKKFGCPNAKKSS